MVLLFSRVIPRTTRYCLFPRISYRSQPNSPPHALSSTALPYRSIAKQISLKYCFVTTRTTLLQFRTQRVRSSPSLKPPPTNKRLTCRKVLLRAGVVCLPHVGATHSAWLNFLFPILNNSPFI